MKKIPKNKIYRLSVHAKKHGQHNHRRHQKQKLLRKIEHFAAMTGTPKDELILRQYSVDAPPKLNFSENYEETIKFIKKLRQDSCAHRRRYSVNFKTIQELSPTAALVLTAEIDRWRRIKSARLRPLELRKWNPDVRRLLNEMGFFEILGIENPCNEADFLKEGDLKFIKFSSGDISDGTYAKNLRIELEKLAGTINTRIFMYNGLIEAMSNSVEHAYPEDKLFHSQINRRWWMSGSYNKATGRMTVMVYDQGVGIPTTLPVSRFKDFVFSFLNSLKLTITDANLIRAAMQIGRTQTELENRGLGLNEMKEFVNRSGRGILRIISSKGDYVFYSNGREEVKDNKSSLNGTLIAWEIYTKDEA